LKNLSVKLDHHLPKFLLGENFKKSPMPPEILSETKINLSSDPSHVPRIQGYEAKISASSS